MTQLVIHEVAVILKKGDITHEDVDAIVNLNNKTLDQNFGVSNVILKAAGSAVQEECKRLGQLPHEDVVITGAGNLKSEKILHVTGAEKPAGIISTVMKVLKICDQNSLETVTFPAIGTGVANLDAKRSVNSILDGIEKYLSDSKDTTMISEIYIICFTENVYQEYLKVFQFKASILQNVSYIIGGKGVELIKGDITDQAVDGIVNLTNQTLDQSVGVSGAILAAAGTSVENECKRIGKVSYDEIVVTSGGDLKSKNILHLIGPTFSSAIADSVDKILDKCNQCSLQTVALPAIGTGMACIDAIESIEGILDGIKNYFSKTYITTVVKIYIIAIDDDIYQKFLQAFQTKIPNIEEIQLRMSPLLLKELEAIANYPSTWTSMGDKLYMEVDLDKNSAEYKTVENNFINSGGKKHVIKITRIQNLNYYQSFKLKKLIVDRQYPKQANEQHLYHGTKLENTKKINHNGFNRSFAVKTAYGKGIYFAKEASYSCGAGYAVIDKEGLQHVYQAEVITGKWCVGQYSFLEPPPTQENPDVLYDCVVDCVINPSIFVIFCDYGAYPEYLISFKSS